MSKTFKLGEITSFYSGGTPSKKHPEYFTGEIPWITGADIKENGEIEPRSFITQEAVDNSAANIIPRGTVLLVTRTSVGKTAVTKEDTSFSQDITGIKSDPEVLLPRYLSHFLRSRISYFENHARGATIKGINRPAVASLEVPVPNIQNQGRISDLLESITRLQRKRRRSIELLDELTQSLLLNLSATGKELPRLPLREVCRDIQIGPFGSLLHSGDYIQGGIPLINPMHIKDGKISPDDSYTVPEQKALELEKYRIQKGDILMGRRGEMGRCATASGEHEGMICGTGSMVIRPDLDVINSTYLESTLRSAPIKRTLEDRAIGSTLPNLNQKIVGDLIIDVPPMDVQSKYLNDTQKIRSLKEAHARHLTTLDELFASVQQRAFDGTLWDDSDIAS